MRSQPTKRTAEIEPEEMDYQKDLEINPHFLDAEFLGHANLFMKYATLSAEANKELREAEEHVKTTRSELIREAKNSGDKHTETTLEAYYRLDPEYIKAKERFVEASYNADMLTNAVFAMQARKCALENLVRLHGQEYYSNPREPHDLPEAVEELAKIKSKSANSRIKERMNRR